MKQKKYVDESYAFWTNAPDEELDLHFNEWYSPPECYIDIGVRVCRIKCASVLKIYIPFNFRKEDLRDLFEDLKDRKTATALFNTVTDILLEDRITVGGKPLGDPSLFGSVYELIHQYRTDYVVKLEDITTLSPQYDEDEFTPRGAVISIDFSRLAAALEGCDLYFRFRLPHPPLQKKNLKRGDNSAFIETPNRNTKIQYMQRVNEMRSLPAPLRCDPTIHKQYIGKVMSMVAASRRFEIDDSGCYKIRQLELNLHRDYLPEAFKKKTQNAIVYQWKAENKREGRNDIVYSFVFPIKIMRQRFGPIDLALYLGWTFLISTVTSLLWYFFSKLLP